MKKKQQSDFTILTRKNIEKIAAELDAGNGIILIADPQYYASPHNRMTGEFEMHLFDRSTIDVKREWINVPRGSKKVRGQDHQTGWEKDREYRLKEKPRPVQKQEDGGLHNRLARLYGQPGNLNEMYDVARSFFERLSVGDYEFEICLQSCIGRGLDRNKYSHWQAYYIPRSVSPQAALTHSLKWMLDKWNDQKPPKGWPERFKFTTEHIEAMVNYALEDLRTGKVLAHNVKAGMDADAFVSF